LIELKMCLAMQSWVNREYRRGLSTHPCEAPTLRISGMEMLIPTFTTRGQEVHDPIAQGEIETQGLQLDDELGGYYGVEC
jgi:hypothetical protein